MKRLKIFGIIGVILVGILLVTCKKNDPQPVVPPAQQQPPVNNIQNPPPNGLNAAEQALVGEWIVKRKELVQNGNIFSTQNYTPGDAASCRLHLYSTLNAGGEKECMRGMVNCVLTPTIFWTLTGSILTVASGWNITYQSTDSLILESGPANSTTRFYLKK